MRHDVESLLKELYERTVRWQAKHGIEVVLTFDEYKSLWSAYRLNKLATLIDEGEAKLRGYLKNPVRKPVCGWKSKQDRASGVMTKDNCKIMGAEEQKRIFQFNKGDKHSAQTREMMKKPKSEATRQKMAAAAKERWAKYRAEKGENK